MLTKNENSFEALGCSLMTQYDNNVTIYQCRVCGKFTLEPYHCRQKARILLKPDVRMSLSKVLALILRHKPSAFNIHLSHNGFTVETIDVVAHRIGKKKGIPFEADHIRAIAMFDPKGRFEIRNNRIRAVYGHSINVDLGFEPVKHPPEIIYHASPIGNRKIIMELGILPQKRKFVHLSLNKNDAIEVARRHISEDTLDKRVVLFEISTSKLKELGVELYRPAKLVFIATHIPPAAIVGAEII